MSEPIDLRGCLEAWPFDPENNARIVRFPGGREVLHVRLAMGLEQYELAGRPDGVRPHGHESLLDYHLDRFGGGQAQGGQKRVELEQAECGALFHEGILYYYRYVHLFQLKEWRLTERDTARNLRLFDFVHRHARHEEDRVYLEKWRPYLLRMNAIARAMIELDQGGHAQAQAIISEAIQTIERLAEIHDETFQFERRRSLGALRDLAAQLEQTKPLSEVERLEKALEQAVSAQEFERAAVLRDRLRAMRGRKAGG